MSSDREVSLLTTRLGGRFFFLLYRSVHVALASAIGKFFYRINHVRSVARYCHMNADTATKMYVYKHTGAGPGRKCNAAGLHSRLRFVVQLFLQYRDLKSLRPYLKSGGLSFQSGDREDFIRIVDNREISRPIGRFGSSVFRRLLI